jgi:hypothetical protein
MMRFLLFVLSLLPLPAFAAESMPRVLVALYDAREESSPRTTQIHRFLEMPANHLGFDIHYYPVNDTLPKLNDDVAGIVLWFNNGTEVPEAKSYLSWLQAAQAAGKKVIIIENAGIGDTWRNDVAVVEQWNRVLKNIGLSDDNNWQALTYSARVAQKNKVMIGFERALPPVLPGFADTHVVLSRGESHLRLLIDKGDGDQGYDLVVTGPGGGYVAEDYAIFHIVEKGESKISQWIVNPFLFLKQAMAVDLEPVPDVTTLDGRRIFYSHIDGDGWNNIAEIGKYKENKTIAAEVIEKEILKSYADFIFTVGLITSDVDKECFAAPDSERVARDIFALGNVEPASHTHSHPLFWRFFASYSPAKEKPYLSRYPSAPKHDFFNAMAKKADNDNAWDKASNVVTGETISLGKNDQTEAEALNHDYPTPRSYACRPFDIDEEVTGSVTRVATFAPGKTVKLLQWSGDTSPFAAALTKTRAAGIYNINGGDTRFDNEYPSYSSVAAIGLNVGGERQIYSSNSNENTYTNLWTGRFFGFRYLQRTIENTERPLRVKPINIYFHMYSGEKEASLAALKENLEYARKQTVIPIATSDYAAIANGFYTAKFISEGELRWSVKDRGALQTVRFDGTEYAVDLATSRGVLGYKNFQNSLYVALDAKVDDALVALTKTPAYDHAYLIESRWQVENLQTENTLSFDAHGYGVGSMRWQMPVAGMYSVSATRKGDTTALYSQKISTAEDAVLAFDIADMSHGAPLTITIARENSHV